MCSGSEAGLICSGSEAGLICSGSEAGSYLRLTDSCFTQLKAQGSARTCNDSKREKKNSTGRVICMIGVVVEEGGVSVGAARERPLHGQRHLEGGGCFKPFKQGVRRIAEAFLVQEPAHP